MVVEKEYLIQEKKKVIYLFFYLFFYFFFVIFFLFKSSYKEASLIKSLGQVR